jgi:predicted TIM-barrel fold metal-dependent hydrolase
MIIDAHAHIASWPTLKESENRILESMKTYHIAFSLISDCDCSEYPSVGGPDAHQVSQEVGLLTTLRFVKQHPDILGAAVWINPHNETVTPRLDKLIQNNRKYIFALKFHPYESHLKVTNKKLIPYLNLARKYNLPILVHTAKDKYSDISFLADLALKNPDLTFIAAHLQLCSDNSEGISALKRAPNLYADTAWVPMKNAKKVLLGIGENRIMFGSDNPIDGVDTLNNPMYQDYFHNRSKLRGHLYHNLMYKNAISIYKLHIKIKD